MRRLRHRLLRRAAAVLVLAGVAVQAVPVALAAEGRLDRVREQFVDGEAFDAAWAAAQAAPTPEVAADAFVRTFQAETDLDIPTETLYGLLFGDAFRLVLPDAPGAAFLPAQAGPPAPTLSPTLDAGVSAAALGLAVPSHTGRSAAEGPGPDRSPARSSDARPRAP